MQRKSALFISSLLILAAFLSCNNSQNEQENRSDFPILKGPYLGQKPPGKTPEIFAPGIISTRYHEHSFPTFSPDGSEVRWLTVFSPGQGNGFKPKSLLMVQENGTWSKPVITETDQGYYFGESFYAPAGDKIYFTSMQPLKAGGEERRDGNLWAAGRTNTGLSSPEPLNAHINTDKWEQQPTVTNDGTLYYCGYWKGGRNNYGIYRSEFVNGDYAKPELLPEQINSVHVDWTPFIAPDERYLLFSSLRPGGYGSGDIYVCFRLDNGSWSDAFNLGPEINTDSNERYPYVSPDGKYMFFISDVFIHRDGSADDITYEEILEKMDGPGNGYCDIYWVDAGIIDEIKSERLR